MKTYILLFLCLTLFSSIKFANASDSNDCIECGVNRKGRVPAFIIEEEGGNALEMATIGHIIENKVIESEAIPQLENFLFLHPHSVIEKENSIK